MKLLVYWVHFGPKMSQHGPNIRKASKWSVSYIGSILVQKWTKLDPTYVKLQNEAFRISLNHFRDHFEACRTKAAQIMKLEHCGNHFGPFRAKTLGTISKDFKPRPPKWSKSTTLGSILDISDHGSANDQIRILSEPFWTKAVRKETFETAHLE